MYAVGRRIVDWLGTRRGLAFFATGWSLSNMLHALTRTLPELAIFRGLLGVTEAANIPAGVKAVSEWFPIEERALAVGIFNAGTAIGSAPAVPLVGTIALHFGWRAAFVSTGALGLVWVAVWTAFYGTPSEHPRLGEAERTLILGAELRGEPSPPPLVCTARVQVPVNKLLAMRETRGCIFARVLTDPISYFLSFWVPQYLQDERGFNLTELRNFGWIPCVALAFGNLAAGAIPRRLMVRGVGLDRARKRTILGVSCGMPLVRLGVTEVGHPALALVLVTLVTLVTLPGATSSSRPSSSRPTALRRFPALGAHSAPPQEPSPGSAWGAWSRRSRSSRLHRHFGAVLGGFFLVSLLCNDLGRIRRFDSG